MAVDGIKAETNRIKLEEAIPLATPMRVILEASSICNFRCKFCVHGNPEALKQMQQGKMTMELAEKCVNDMTAFPGKIKTLAFASLGEPLVNDKLPEIVELAVKKKVAERYEITTNGSLLTRELSQKLVNAGVTLFNISIYGLDNEAYKGFSRSGISFNDIVENVAHLYSICGGDIQGAQHSKARVVVKISDAVCDTQAQRDEFYRIFSTICDTITVEHAVPLWYEFDDVKGDGLDIYGRPIVRKDICPLPFFTLTVNADGRVSPCCNDWKQKLIMGDAGNDALRDIWNGQAYRALQKQLLAGGGASRNPCDRCGYPVHVAFDNIDAFREELLERLG